MNSLSPAFVAFIAAVLVQLTITVPIAFALLRTYLQVKENAISLNQRPTHQEVSQQVNKLVDRLTSVEASVSNGMQEGHS